MHFRPVFAQKVQGLPPIHCRCQHLSLEGGGDWGRSQEQCKVGAGCERAREREGEAGLSPLQSRRKWEAGRVVQSNM